MTTTLATLKARLALYTTALENTLTAQSYSVAGRTKQMASLDAIQKQIDILEARIARLEKTNSSSVYTPKFIPKDGLDSATDEDCDE